MTQNLDLDLDAARIYTPKDTDIQSDWTPTNSTVNLPAQCPKWTNSNFVPYSANQGDEYIYSSNDESAGIVYESLEECILAGHSDCLHYHIGNYYNWPAAVAENNTSSLPSGEAAPNSICSAGWRLPYGPDNTTLLSGDFYNMLYRQGNILGASFPWSNSGSYYQDNGFYNIRISPVWFVRSGYVKGRGTDVFVRQKSNAGGYWSSTVRDNSDDANTFAYKLIIL